MEGQDTNNQSARVLFSAQGPDHIYVEFAVYPDGSYAVVCGGQTITHWPAGAEQLTQALQTFRRMQRINSREVSKANRSANPTVNEAPPAANA
jgi:hypothetical protein